MSTGNSMRRIVIGISGASGAIFGIRLLEVLRDLPVETHLVMTRTAEQTIALETDRKPADVRRLADVVHGNADLAAPISSGSFRTMGMIVAPCSVKTMSEIASGVTSCLLTRAADVVIKERGRLVLAVRETPLHGGHLRRMAELADLGVTIAPPMPGMYARPSSLEDMIDHSVGRLLDSFGIEAGLVRRWGETPATK